MGRLSVDGDKEMDAIAILQTLYDNHRYAEVIARAEAASSENIGFVGQFLKLRSHFQLGTYQEVSTTLYQINTNTLKAEERTRLELWCSHWRALMEGNPQLEREKILQSIQPNLFSFLTPHYYRTLATLKALAIHYYQIPLTELATVLDELHLAQASFSDLLETEEYINCLIQEGNVLWQLASDIAGAKMAYQRAEQEAVRFGRWIQQADILIKLAQLKLTQAQTIDISEETIEQQFRHPEQLYKQANHTLGLATLQWTLGKLREQYGFAGRDHFQRALLLFTQVKDKGGIAEALASLSQSYLNAGYLTIGFPLTERLVTAAQVTGFPIRIANAYLSLAEYHARSGVYAQALFYACKAQTLMSHPATKALIGLNLSQFYLRINQSEQALLLCEQTVEQLQGAGDSLLLSLAYNTLGTTQDALARWPEAIQAYQAGILVDERLRASMPLLEKRVNLQWTRAKQAYQQRQPISPQLYAEINGQLEAASKELDWQATPVALNLKAQILQLQSNIAQFAGRFAESLNRLELAADLYSQTNQLMQAATSWATLGLAAWELARRGNHTYFEMALTNLTRASAYFEREQLKEQAWSVQFNLAACWWERGVMTREELTENFQQASQAFHQAADTIDFIRYRFADRDPIQQDVGKVHLVANKEKVYTNAFRFHMLVLNDSREGLYWVERSKGRTLTEMLASVYLPTGPQSVSALNLQETMLRQHLRETTDQELYFTLLEQLRTVWQQMKHNDITRQYAQLRLGEPITFDEIKRYLM